MLIFEQKPQKNNVALSPRANKTATVHVPTQLKRTQRPQLPELSELSVVRHYTKLSHKNFCVDTHFYPLGSCTMKYNPKVCHFVAMQDGFLDKHPLDRDEHNQGLLECLWHLQNQLVEVTGMSGACLSPMAGAQGEAAGILMIKAYHTSRGEHEQRREILIPDAAHGTNPATAQFCGYQVREIPTLPNGNVDLETLKKSVGPQTAGLMLTNPSTLGVFEEGIEEINHIIHDAGGLTYYDGANLNAILGYVRPGDMGFDVMHMNLHKTFATPHGGGGPGSGAIAANKILLPFMPIPTIYKTDDNQFYLTTEQEQPQSIGRLNGFLGNVGVLIRAYAYICLLGCAGLKKVSAIASLNANYMMVRLKEAGFHIPFENRRASHEFIISCQDLKKNYGITAMHVAKRLLDFGVHAPTTYFPLIVPECLLIEPTETESKEMMDYFIDVMIKIREEAINNPEHLKNAPHDQSIQKADEVAAVKLLLLTWKKLHTHRMQTAS